MLKPSFRWICDASHNGALAVHLHLHRPHQLCHPACMVVVVVIMVVVAVIMVEVVFSWWWRSWWMFNHDDEYVNINDDVGGYDIFKRSLGLGNMIMTLPSIPIMAPINPPLTSQSAQPE